MITIITLINNQEDYEVLKRNLVSLETDWDLGLALLCIVSNKELYLEVRNFLLENVNRGECRVVYGSSLKDGKDYLSDNNSLVFLLNVGVIIPQNTLTRLYKNYVDKPQAGFISGILKEYPIACWVKNIYSHPQFVYFNEKEKYDLLMDVDVSACWGLLTKVSLYKELFCTEGLDGYGEYSFGIKLRRQGYKNYVDTGVEYKHRRNNENYHAEGSAC